MVADSDTTVGQLKERVKRFCEERDWTKYHSAKELVIGVVTEASELLQLMRFKSDGEVDALLESQDWREKFSDEMADVLYFLLRLADLYGLDLSEALDHKLEKNALKYPVDKYRGSNKRYDEKQQCP